MYTTLSLADILGWGMCSQQVLRWIHAHYELNMSPQDSCIEVLKPLGPASHVMVLGGRAFGLIRFQCGHVGSSQVMGLALCMERRAPSPHSLPVNTQQSGSCLQAKK